MWLKGILLFGVIFLIVECSSSSKKQVKGKERILVMDETKSSIIIREGLSKSNLFEVITVEDQKKALSRMKDCSTSNCALELGKILFAKLILTANIKESKDFNSLCIILKISDVQKGLYSTGYQNCYLLIPNEWDLKDDILYQGTECSMSRGSWAREDCDAEKNVYISVDAYESKPPIYNYKIKEIFEEAIKELIENYKKTN